MILKNLHTKRDHLHLKLEKTRYTVQPKLIEPCAAQSNLHKKVYQTELLLVALGMHAKYY